ncbi:MAG: YceI family protein [Acidimicrobiia bacterium]
MTLPLHPGRYALDLTHTQIGFVVTHLGLTPIRGVFARFDGGLDVGATPAECALDVSVELASLQSSHPGREQHVQGEDFFDSTRHPTMLFRSTGIEGDGNRWSCAGELTLRGMTAPITLHTELTGRALFPLDQKEHIGFIGTGTLSRRTFGVAPNIPSLLLSDDIRIELSVQLIAP